MKLYFLRHGIAEDPRAGLPDARRALTPEGEAQMRAVGRGMEALGLRFDAILTSPLARARQTAEIAARELGQGERVREEPALASGAGLPDLARALEGQPETARLLLVGHEPDFSEMIGALIGGGSVRVKKASLACVEALRVRSGSGELRWLLKPEHLCRLGDR